MFDVIKLAKYIINKCTIDGKAISNLQLQKILYYIQKEYLKRNGVIAFDNRIDAWPYGPVVRPVYNKFCGYGAMPITMEYTDIDLQEPTDIVDEIVTEKREMDPWELVAETHREGGAWNRIYEQGKGRGREIPVQLIQECG